MPNQSFSREFITALLTKAELTDEKGKIDPDYVAKLAEQLDKKMGLFLLSKLSVEDLDAYYKLADDNAKPEDLNKFLSTKIANFSELKKKFLDDYAYNFFNRSEKIKTALSK